MRLRACVRLMASLAAFACTSAWAAAVPVVAFRVEDHGRFGRVVVVLPEGVTYGISRHGDDEILHFNRAVRLRRLVFDHVAEIVSLEPADDTLTVRLQPSTVIRIAKAGAKVVLDLFAAVEPPIRTEAVSQHESLPPSSSAVSILPGLPSPLVAVIEAPATPAGKPSSRDSLPTGGSIRTMDADSRSSLQPAVGDDHAGPVSIAASVIPSTPSYDGGLMLPFDRQAGAAAFRRGNMLVVVFDNNKPVDLAPVAADPVFGQASFSLLPTGAVLTLPLKAGEPASVRREPDGWLISTGRPGKPGTSIEPRAARGTLTLPIAEPGHVVVVPDPVSGTDLLVGTVRRDGQNMPIVQRRVDYNLGATLLGVAVERLSDQLEMRPTSGGFVLSEGHEEDIFQSTSVGFRGGFSRSLDLPAVAATELQRRYKEALAMASASPAAGRRSFRLDAAEAAIGLDRGREAGELAAIADQDAPTGADTTRSAFLQAAASMLVGNPDAATRLGDPAVGDTDEVALWRALELASRHPDNAEAARTIAERLALIQSYPDRLRRHLLGNAALSLVGGPVQAEAALVSGLNGNGKVKLAQALLDERDGQGAKALAPLDLLAADPDPAVALHAVEEAVNLRLRLHQIDPKQAADRLEAQILDARMTNEEPALRLNVAALRARQGDFAAALGNLREILGAFPEASAQAHRAATEILKRIADPGTLAGNAPLFAEPVAELALLEGNLDLLPDGAEGRAVLIELAKRLAALDLPDRASALLRKALVQAAAGPERASLGLELAGLCLDQNDATGANSALSTTEAPGLPPELVASRMLLHAKVIAATGNADATLQALEPLHGVDVEELRAQELAAKHDWAAETVALNALAGLTLPASGPLNATEEDLVVRLAGAASRAGDQETLRLIVTTWRSRFRDADKIDMLRLLTSSSVTTVGDLPRSASELNATRNALSTLVSTSARIGG